MSIEFDRMILPGANVLPLSAKVINAPHNKVDAKGDIKGKGHPTRDSLLWTVPVFWPSKILTLPARGPFPTLKGETRLTLRLMEDVEVPFAVANNGVPKPDYRPSAYRGSSSLYQPASTVQRDDSPVRRITYSEPRSMPSQRHGQVTVIALQAGTALIASHYWVEGEDLHCVSQDGSEQSVPLTLVDLAQTVRVNQERNVAFSLHSRPRERSRSADDGSVVQQ
jgi:hypothetical protein